MFDIHTIPQYHSPAQHNECIITSEMHGIIQDQLYYWRVSAAMDSSGTNVKCFWKCPADSLPSWCQTHV